MKTSSILGAMLLLCACARSGGGGPNGSPRDEGGEATAELSTGSECPAVAPTYRAFAEPFFQQYCVSCHSSDKEGDARHGAPDDADFESYEGIRAHLEEIDERAAAGPEGVHDDMPRGDGPRPSEAERRMLGQWLACGAPSST